MSAPEILPSATLILLRQSARGIETVLLQRHEAMAFGSAWVFPGGKIDAEDYEKIPDHLSGEAKEIAAAVHAAIRETKEEANVDIQAENLVLMSCWTTPALGDRPRFRTWFFVAELDAQTIVVDGSEMLDHRWVLLNDAIEPENVRAFGMLPPTYNTLLDIHAYPDVTTAIQALQKLPLRVYNPRLIGIEGGFISLYEGDAGYETKDLLAIGPRHRLIGDKDGYRLERTID